MASCFVKNVILILLLRQRLVIYMAENNSITLVISAIVAIKLYSIGKLMIIMLDDAMSLCILYIKILLVMSYYVKIICLSYYAM